MKIRTGFVSNSSTTSFCIIGVDNEAIVDKLLQACGYDNEWYHQSKSFGAAEADSLTFYGDYNKPYWAGLDADTLLVDKTLPQAREWFIKYVQDKLNITLSQGDVRLRYGEVRG